MRVSGALILVSAAAMGCSATVVDAGEDADSAGTRGNLSVEQVVSGAGTRTSVSARFVRVSGAIDHDDAEAFIRTPGRVSPDAPPGCRWQASTTASAPPSAADGSIELLDVGDIVLRAGAQMMPLAARAFPDVGDLVSGVVYTSRGGDGALPLADSYLIETSGSGLVDGFSLRVEVPETPRGVRLRQAGQQMPLLDAQPGDLLISAAESLGVSWERSSHAGDQIVVELAPIRPHDDDTATLVCSFEDEGAATVPASQLAIGLGPGAEVDVTVHRLRKTTLRDIGAMHADRGIDGAIVELDFAVTARAAAVE